MVIYFLPTRIVSKATPKSPATCQACGKVIRGTIHRFSDVPDSAFCSSDCQVSECEPVVFEINPRFSGGIPLTIAAGADFTKYLVELTLGRDVPARIGQFRDNLWMTSYEASIFVEAGELATGRKPPLLIGEVA